MGFVEPEAIQPEDLAVIGHDDDLLCWIHALACTHILPQNLLLFNSRGEGVQLARSWCSVRAVALFSFTRNIQAKKAFDELGVKKLPTVKSLQVEFADLLTAKKEAYAELKKVRDELRDLTVHTANYEELRDLEEREKRKEKEHGRE